MIHLRSLHPADAEGMLEWMKDPEIQACFQRSMGELTREDVLKFIANNAVNMSEIQLNELENSNLHFAIADENEEYLGTISLKNINTVSRNAEYAISTRIKAHGTGAAYAATQQLLGIAFERLELKKVYLNVLEENKRAINFYKKVGFVYEGIARNHIKTNTGLKSLEWYSMLDSEFKERMNS